MIKNLKKVISSIAAVAIIASSASAFAIDFPDVDSSASYAGAVQTLVGLGIVNGDENGKFNPDNSVTRAEFAKMVVEAKMLDATSTTTQFEDSQGHWAVGYIEAGVGDKFINGYSDTEFGPDDTVTYIQAVKMLVAAVGYGDLAEKNGGYPTGYRGYGKTLKISTGLTGVNDDTALTRAQCAVLIDNALKAQLALVDYQPNLNGQLVAVPDIQGDETGETWESLLTYYHDAYVVKGRVMETGKQDTALREKNAVSFNVEVAENFEDVKYGNNAAASRLLSSVYVGSTDAANMMFEYVEAIIKADEASGEYELISIVPYGKSEVVELAAEDFVDTYVAANKKLEVYKSKDSTSTDKYDLADTVELYVNGVKVNAGLTEDTPGTPATKGTYSKYIAENETGTVTLIDQTTTGSTSTDGKYEKVMVTKYDTYLVSNVQTTSEKARVYCDTARIEWTLQDVENGTKTVQFVKDGKVIDYTELEENDVLTVAYDVTAANLNASAFIDATVTSDVVTGVVSSKNNTDNTIVVDGTEYDLAGTLGTSDFTIGRDYTLRLDAFGNVVAKEQGTTQRNIGIVVKSYVKTGDDVATIRLINSNGEIVEYEAKDATEATTIMSKILDGNKTANAAASGYDVKKTADALKDALIEYRIVNGKIRFEAEANNVSPFDDTYRESGSRLGSYAIAKDVTKVIDLSSYIAGNDPAVFDIANFVDDESYAGFVADRENSVYDFAFLTTSTTSARPGSNLAVVTKLNGSTEAADGTPCDIVTVAVNGQEDVQVLFEDGIIDGIIDSKTTDANMANFVEGAAIVYAVGSNGYVEKKAIDTNEDGEADNFANVEVIYAPKATYDNWFKSNKKPIIVSERGVKVDGVDGSGLAKAVKYAVLPVYKSSGSSLELIKTIAATSNVTTGLEYYTMLDSTNKYTYDYAAKAGRGIRVTAGVAAAQSEKVFTNSYYKTYTGIGADTNVADANKVTLNWKAVSDNDVKPMFAFVRTIDNDVTDVIFYIAD